MKLQPSFSSIIAANHLNLFALPLRNSALTKQAHQCILLNDIPGKFVQLKQMALIETSMKTFSVHVPVDSDTGTCKPWLHATALEVGSTVRLRLAQNLLVVEVLLLHLWYEKNLCSSHVAALGRC